MRSAGSARIKQQINDVTAQLFFSTGARPSPNLGRAPLPAALIGKPHAPARSAFAGTIKLIWEMQLKLCPCRIALGTPQKRRLSVTRAVLASQSQLGVARRGRCQTIAAACLVAPFAYQTQVNDLPQQSYSTTAANQFNPISTRDCQGLAGRLFIPPRIPVGYLPAVRMGESLG